MDSCRGYPYLRIFPFVFLTSATGIEKRSLGLINMTTNARRLNSARRNYFSFGHIRVPRADAKTNHARNQIDSRD
jgi:hypothetical protein